MSPKVHDLQKNRLKFPMGVHILTWVHSHMIIYTAKDMLWDHGFEDEPTTMVYLCEHKVPFSGRSKRTGNWKGNSQKSRMGI